MPAFNHRHLSIILIDLEQLMLAGLLLLMNLQWSLKTALHLYQMILILRLVH